MNFTSTPPYLIGHYNEHPPAEVAALVIPLQILLRSPRANAGGIATADTLQRGLSGLFEYSRRALELVWTTNSALSIALAALTLLAGVLPAAIAYVGALIVDAVIHAADLHRHAGAQRSRACS